ncbi:chemotaxis protein MotB [Rhodophyticola sp. CCM32]|nr:chemotaxis protein MotB [Rhodophyticola sp. CCM32]
MSGQNDPRPIIIKRKKVAGGEGHHGGAWKVAYADFVTAMMAFFLLMWLLNATTEQQRKGLADYFSPTVPIARISGGGDGAFGGESVFSETVEAQNGTGASNQRPTEGRQSMGMTGSSHREEAEQAALAAVEDALMAGGGDSMVSDMALRHVQTRLSDEGLIIEIFARPDDPLFEEVTGAPVPWLVNLSDVMAGLFDTVTNHVALNGYTRSEPIMVTRESRWATSIARAQIMRELLQSAGLPPARIDRVTGHADRHPADADPMSERNDRIEIILLRHHL